MVPILSSPMFFKGMVGSADAISQPMCPMSKKVPIQQPSEQTSINIIKWGIWEGARDRRAGRAGRDWI
ncbi:MAG TPA: hypothetical protein PK360_15620, partial [bacterium]|nr:hypothetical protein [bacterium]